MAFILEIPPILIRFGAAFSATLALGIYWVAERYLNGATSDQVFYWALGGVAVCVALVLLQIMPS